MKRSNDSGRAIGYIRVSTDEQRLGPKAQAAAIERWAAREGIQMVAYFVDHGVSGATPIAERKGLLCALAALQPLDAGVLLAGKRDRLARDVGIARGIEAAASKEGALVRTADGTSDATGSAAVISKGLHDLLGEWEREVIRERTTAALALKRAKGERTGGVPYGYRLAPDQKILVIDPIEQQTIERIRSLSAQGTSIRKIVAQLNAEQVPARGACWHVTSVARLIKSQQRAA